MRDRLRFEAEVAALAEIFPPNSLTRVADTTVAPFRWICQIETTSAGGELSTGTGFLIGPRHVLTSAHVIYPMKPGETRPQQKTRSIRVYPGRHGGNEPFGGHDANGWTIDPRWIAGREAHCAFDYGLIRLKRSFADRRMGFWGHEAGTRFAAIAPRTLDGLGMFSAGYPFRRGLNELAARVMKQSDGRVTGSADLARCSPAAWRGRFSPRVEANARLLTHDVDTERGQSGCPLWIRDGATLTLAAIHQGELTRNGARLHNIGVLITHEVFDRINAWIRNFVE